MDHLVRVELPGLSRGRGSLRNDEIQLGATATEQRMASQDRLPTKRLGEAPSQGPCLILLVQAARHQQFGHRHSPNMFRSKSTRPRLVGAMPQQ
jgi:hypothetical protein